MNSTLLTSKGQVTVPKPFRDYLGLKPGAAVEFAFAPDGQVVIKPAGIAPRIPRSNAPGRTDR